MTAPALHLVPSADPTPLERLRDLVDREPETVLAGVAGTGKTWHVQHLLDRPGVVLCAPTAKAAQRMTEVCRTRALTVHSLIYGAPVEQWVRSSGEVCDGWTDDRGVHHPPPKCPGCACSARLTFTLPDREDDDDVSLIVVDEASMVGAELARDIRSVAERLNSKILWVGDPAQLPPVGDAPGVDLHDPDVLLDVVHRAQGGILALATAIRRSESFADLDAALRLPYPDVSLEDSGLSGLADWRAGRSQRMAIVHSNRQRVDGNAWVRETLKRPGPLTRGDRILIRKNQRSANVWNGEIYVVESVDRVEQFTRIRARLDGLPNAVTVHLALDERYLSSTDRDEFGRDARELQAAHRALAGIDHHAECSFNDWDRGESECPRARFHPSGERCTDRACPQPHTVQELCTPGPLRNVPLVYAQHGFVITCHAAQGSEADEVGVLWSPRTHGDRFAEARAWLYTAVTRARRSLTVFR